MALVSATSASAAGAPIVTKGGLVLGKQMLNGGPFKAKINPNGAPTTYHVIYGKKATYLDSTTPTYSVGSGTTDVVVENNLLGLNPDSVFYTRVVASNSFGTTFGELGEPHTAHWEGRCLSCSPPWKLPELYKSTGTFKLKQTSAPAMTITCNENGYGEIGNAGGIGDHYTMELTKCVMENHPECKIGWYGPLVLGANFQASGSPELILQVKAGGGCQEFEESIAGTPFELAMGLPNEQIAVNQPLTLTQHSNLGITITDTTSWSLAGLGQGGKFAWNFE